MYAYAHDRDGPVSRRICRSGESETIRQPSPKKTHLTHRRFPFKRGYTHAQHW